MSINRRQDRSLAINNNNGSYYDENDLQQLKEQIISIVQSINQDKFERRKFLTACKRLQQTRVAASLDKVVSLKYKLHQTRLQLDQLTRNPPLVYDPIDGEDILRRLTRPEHFNATNRDYYQHLQSLSTSKGESVWNTSEYKLSLLRSLYTKLLLKTVFCALQHVLHVTKSMRQLAERIQQKTIAASYAISFKAIAFSRLSNQYIALASELKSHSYFFRKKCQYTMIELRMFVHKGKHSKAIMRTAIEYQLENALKCGISELLYNRQQLMCSRAVFLWSRTTFRKRLLSKALSGWMISLAKRVFLKRMKLNQVQQQLGSDKYSVEVSTSRSFPSSFDDQRQGIAELSPQQLQQRLEWLQGLLHQLHGNTDTSSMSISGGVNSNMASNDDLLSSQTVVVELLQTLTVSIRSHQRQCWIVGMQELKEVVLPSLRIIQLSHDVQDSNGRTAVALLGNKLRTTLRKQFSVFHYNMNKRGGKKANTQRTGPPMKGNNLSHQSSSKHNMASIIQPYEFMSEKPFIAQRLITELRSLVCSLMQIRSERQKLITQVTAMENATAKAISASAQRNDAVNVTDDNRQESNSRQEKVEHNIDRTHPSDSSIDHSALSDLLGHSKKDDEEEEWGRLYPHNNRRQQAQRKANYFTSKGNKYDRGQLLATAEGQQAAKHRNKIVKQAFCGSAAANKLSSRLVQSLLRRKGYNSNDKENRFQHDEDDADIYDDGDEYPVDSDSTSSEDMDDIYNQAYLLRQRMKNCLSIWIDYTGKHMLKRAQLSKRSQLISQRRIKKTIGNCWGIWNIALAKVYRKFHLCQQISQRNACRRAIRKWFRKSIIPYSQLQQKLISTTKFIKKKQYFQNWQNAMQMNYLEVRLQLLHKRSEKSFLRSILMNWHQNIIWVKRINWFHKRNKKDFFLKYYFTIYKSKVNQIAILRRVFTIHENAWQYRQQNSLSDFQRLYIVLISWKEYLEEQRRARTELYKLTTASVFYTSSLLAKIFMNWSDYVCKLQQIRQKVNQTYQQNCIQFVKRIFSKWSRYALSRKLIQLTYIRDCCTRRDNQLLRNCILQWRNYLLELKYKEFQIENYANRKYLVVYWKIWMYERYLLRLEAVVHARNNLFIYKRSLKFAMIVWRRAQRKQQHIRRGTESLESILLRHKLRRVFALWPGRQSFALAESLRLRLLRKGRGRARLVQCSIDRHGKPIEEEEEDDDEDHNDHFGSSRNRALHNRHKRLQLNKHKSTNNTNRHNRHYNSNAISYGTTTEESSVSNTSIDDSNNCASFIDFDTNVRPLHERVMRLSADKEDVVVMITLMKAILHEWNRATLREYELRRKARICRWATGKRLLIKSLREWVGLTPLTAHRLLVWMPKQFPMVSKLNPSQMKRYIESRKYHFGHNIVTGGDATMVLEDEAAKYVDEDGFDPFSMHIDVNKIKTFETEEIKAKKRHKERERLLRIAARRKLDINVKDFI